METVLVYSQHLHDQQYLGKERLKEKQRKTLGNSYLHISCLK